MCVCVCRDEQYRSLWGEIETLTRAYSSNSDRHRTLLDLVVKLIASSPSDQHARKTIKTSGTWRLSRVWYIVCVSADSGMSAPPPATSSSYKVTEKAWQELDMYGHVIHAARALVCVCSGTST